MQDTAEQSPSAYPGGRAGAPSGSAEARRSAIVQKGKADADIGDEWRRFSVMAEIRTGVR